MHEMQDFLDICALGVMFKGIKPNHVEGFFASLDGRTHKDIAAEQNCAPSIIRISIRKCVNRLGTGWPNKKITIYRIQQLYEFIVPITIHNLIGAPLWNSKQYKVQKKSSLRQRQIYRKKYLKLRLEYQQKVQILREMRDENIRKMRKK